MFDYQFWFPILALLIAAYAANLQRKQTNLTISQALKPDGGVSPPSWWKSPAVIAVFILACLTWGPYILSQIEPEVRLQSVGTEISGPADLLGRFINITLNVSLDGNEIYKYYPQKVMAVAYHWPIDKDIDDTQDLQKSPV
jgi:hypothetical protein